MSEGKDDRSLEHSARPERVAYSMRALGKVGLPERFNVSGIDYRLVRTVKHDFFAATGFYEDAAGVRVVLKAGRVEEFAGLPLEWLGRWLCRREQRFYSKVTDIAAVPKVLGTVGATGFVLQFVEGTPLSDCPCVPDGLFAELQSLLAELHRRRLAYVDTNKTQNILVGHDGRVHLIDFQISWDLEDFGDWWLTRFILTHMQKSDVYHVLKHKMRMRPDELQPGERELAEHRSFVIRAHRFLVKPYRGFRRRMFHRLRESGRLLPEGSK